MSSELPLRPHHGLCLGFFIGEGYDSAFRRNMAAVLADLTPETPIRLTMDHDVLCACCPNRTAPCPNAAVYDRRVLEHCGLERGQALTWGGFRRRIQANILAPGRLAAVCGGCRWADICGRAAARDR